MSNALTVTLSRRDVFCGGVLSWEVLFRSWRGWTLLCFFTALVYFDNSYSSTLCCGMSFVARLARSIGWAAAIIGCMLAISALVGACLLVLTPKRRLRGVLGEHRFVLSNDGLSESTDVNETLHKWAGITRVWSRFGYTFVQISPALAHVIPASAVHAGNYDEFVTALHASFAANRSG